MEEKCMPDGGLPWTRSCFVCGQDNTHGLKLKPRVEGGRVVLEHTVREEDVGWKGIMHGGIAMALLDEVMTWASILCVRKGCVSAEFTARLRKPIPTGEHLRVEGWVGRPTRRLLCAEGHILCGTGDVLAAASGKYVPLPREQAEAFSKDFVPGAESERLGWLPG